MEEKLYDLILQYIEEQGPVSQQEIKDVFIPWYKYYDIILAFKRLQDNNLIISIQRKEKPDWFIINKERN